MAERGVTEPCLALTLNEPSSPDCIVQTDLVPPQQTQTLERLPLGRDDLTTARKKIVTPKKPCNFFMENVKWLVPYTLFSHGISVIGNYGQTGHKLQLPALPW